MDQNNEKILNSILIFSLLISLSLPASSQMEPHNVKNVAQSNKSVDVRISKDSIYYFNKAKSEYAYRDYNSAINDLTTSIKLYPKCESYAFRAVIKESINDNLGAIQDYNSAIKLNPNINILYDGKGYAQLNSNYFYEAIKSFNYSIKLKPNDNNAWLGKALVKTRLEDYNGVIQDLSEAIRLNPNNYNFFELRATAKLNLRFYQDAI